MNRKSMACYCSFDKEMRQVLVAILEGVLRFLALGVISFYQCVVRPHFLWGHCRFTPSCSVYAQQVFTRFGARKGALLAKRRLSKCHPYGQLKGQNKKATS
ncbi:MAG: membrane protein insertion efficiency factor YidD, partial [Holosporaceae bacterium]